MKSTAIDFSAALADYRHLAIRFDLQGRVLDVLGEMKSLVQFQNQEIKGEFLSESSFLPEQYSIWTQNFHQSVIEKKIQTFELYWIEKAGACHLISWTLIPDGEGVWALLVDQTESHRSQIVSLEQSQLLEQLRNHFPGGAVALFNLQSMVLFAGGQAWQEMGVLLPVSHDYLLKYLPEKLKPIVGERLSHVFKGMSFVFESHHRGMELEVQIRPTFSADRKVTGGIFLATNITSQKEIEKRFQGAKDRYQILFESNPHAMWIYDSNSFQVLGANTAATQHYHFSREEFLDMNFLDLHPEKDRVDIRNVLGGDQELFNISGTWLHLTKEKKPNYVQLSTHEYDLLDRDVRLMLAIDVTRQYQVEQALLMSEQRFRSLVQNSYDVIMILDANGVIRFASPACEKIVGYSVEEMEGQTSFDYVYPDDLARVRETFENLVRDSHAKETIEYRFKRSDGTWIYIESIGINLMENPSVQGIVVNSRDVSDRRQLTDQLRQSQKMESIGRLAGGIAHDFNNILTAIQGYADLALMGGEPEALQDYIQQISMASNRAASLTHQLLAFSRQQVIQLKLMDLNQVITQMSMMLIRLLGEGVHFKVDCDPDLPMVEGDKGMIEQILLNLVVNARDAMQDGGELSVRTSLRMHSGLKNYGRSLQPNAICLEVQDSGSGMDQKTREHIFEPFFTTKEIGKGTGLGLSTVYGIVAQHQGLIEVDSELGKGTLFKIYFPISEKTLPLTTIHETLESRIKGNNELILVVEDENAVRDMMVKVLNRQGYRTVEASSAAQALVVWTHQRKDIRLILTDIMMPGGMSGCEMAKRILSQDPAASIVFCSGYSPRLVSDGTELNPGVNFLQKPFSPNDLAKIIRDKLLTSAQS